MELSAATPLTPMLPRVLPQMVSSGPTPPDAKSRLPERIASFIGAPLTNCTHSLLRSRPRRRPCSSSICLCSMMVSGRYEMPNCLAMRTVVCACAVVATTTNAMVAAATTPSDRMRKTERCFTASTPELSSRGNLQSHGRGRNAPFYSMIPKSGCRFRKRSCSNTKVGRDGDSKKSHLALAGQEMRFQILARALARGQIPAIDHRQPEAARRHGMVGCRAALVKGDLRAGNAGAASNVIDELRRRMPVGRRLGAEQDHAVAVAPAAVVELPHAPVV